MKRKISPRGRRRGQINIDDKNETVNDRTTDFDVDNESDSDIKYTSTPLKKIDVNCLEMKSSAPNFNFESEESTDVVKVSKKYLKRRKTSRSMKKRGIPGTEIIYNPDNGEKRRRRSRRRRSEGSRNSLEDLKNEESAEIPIADILRNAQENEKNIKTRYEDPIPLPELTTDTLYVQGRNGFSAVKIDNFRSEKGSIQKLFKPIHVAIKIHNFSKTLMLFCQGLLGGISLGQVILVTKIKSGSNFPMQIDSAMISGIFLFLVTISLLAAMDRIDVGNLDLENFREIFSNRFTTILTFPLYLVALCIHLSAMNVEESPTIVGKDAVGSDVLPADDEDYVLHRQTQTWKFAICIIAWFFIAILPSEDLTSTNLEAMKKYATN